MIKLKKNESILTAWPEPCAGPGGGANLVWVIISDGPNFRRECL